jgi:hypothetical protein
MREFKPLSKRKIIKTSLEMVASIPKTKTVLIPLNVSRNGGPYETILKVL